MTKLKHKNNNKREVIKPKTLIFDFSFVKLMLLSFSFQEITTIRKKEGCFNFCINLVVLSCMHAKSR